MFAYVIISELRSDPMKVDVIEVNGGANPGLLVIRNDFVTNDDS